MKLHVQLDQMGAPSLYQQQQVYKTSSTKGFFKSPNLPPGPY